VHLAKLVHDDVLGAAMQRADPAMGGRLRADVDTNLQRRLKQAVEETGTRDLIGDNPDRRSFISLRDRIDHGLMQGGPRHVRLRKPRTDALERRQPLPDVAVGHIAPRTRRLGCGCSPYRKAAPGGLRQGKREAPG
jgi:hypothetical protein